METKSARGKQTANRSKLPIIIAALVVVLLLLVLGALLLFGGSEPQPTPTEPTTSTQDPSKPSETTPPPVNVPVKVWDMEALPENLIDAGMAYANSSNTIYGNLRIGAGKGKGLGGSTAFAYTFVGNYSDADVYVMSPASLKGQNLISDWTKGEMLWFWVNGTELLQNVRLEITINGKYMPIGSTYYTIDKEGQCVPVGTIPEGWGTTTTRGRIRLDMGWEGWIGLPIEETYGEIKNLTSIQIIVGNSTIKAGNILYLDEFWLTEMGEVPPLSKEELTYSALDALLESLTLGQIWDLETPEVGAQLGNIAATSGRNNPISAAYANKGVSGSKAWGYVLEQVNNTNSQNVTMSALALEKIGFQQRAIKDPSNIFWFWVDSQMSGNVMLHLQLNGNFQSRDSIYTIAVKDGQPSIQVVKAYDSKGSVNGVSVVPNNGNSTGAYGRIEISEGWSGWLGIPIKNFCVNSDGTPAEIPAGKLGSFIVRLYAPADSLKAGDGLYFDEFWITEAGKMPDLGKAQLTYGYTATKEKPTVGYGQIWDGGDANNVAAGTQIGNIGADSTRNNISTIIVDNKGVGGSKAWSYVLNSTDKTNGNNVSMTIGELSEYGFKIANVTADSDILWMWVDSAQSMTQLLHLQINGTAAFMDQKPIFGIAPDAEGKAEIVEIPYYTDANLVYDGVGVVPQGGYARIKLCNGWSGWLGIPVANFCVTSAGEPVELNVKQITQITMRNFASKDTLTAGDTIILDEIWLTPTDTMPSLTNEQLLYGYVAPTVPEEPEGPHKTPLQNFDAIEDGSYGKIQANGNYTDFVGSVVSKHGLSTSKALKYYFVKSGNTNTDNIFLDQGVHIPEVMIGAETDILWLWIGTDMIADRALHLQMNGNFMSRDTIYTIGDANNDGKAEIIEVPYAEDPATVTTIAPIDWNNEVRADRYARIKIAQGWSGWIGVSVNSFRMGSDASEKAVLSGPVVSINMRLFSLGTAFTADDMVYFDEFWLTSAGLMPDLSDEALLYTYTPPVVTEINLTNRFQNGMIFQQNKPWIVNGTGVIGETVTVELINKENATVQTKTATVDADSNWFVTMDAVVGSYDAYTVKVSSGNNTKTIENVVFGEVWAAGGQSNMAYNFKPASNGDNVVSEADKIALQAELAAYEKAGYLRFFMSNAAHAGGLVVDDVVGSWGNASDWEAVRGCSATALYFIKNLEAVLNVPVGVVVGAAGGTNLSAWVNPEIAQADADFYKAVQDLGYVGSSAEPRAMLGGWFNSRVAAWAGFEVNGFIWYQGEQDKVDPTPHKLGYDVLVDSWSKVFNSEATVDGLPLVAIQIHAAASSNPNVPKLNTANELNAAMREGVKVLTSKVTLVQLYDLSVDITNNHPQNKPALGARAAVAALNMVYGQGSIYSGPVLESADYSIAGQITLTFSNVGTGLKYIQLTEEANKRFEPEGFPMPTDMYVDAINGFSVWTGTEYVDITNAAIVGHNQIVLTLPEGVVPAGVSYGHSLDILTANVFNEEGFPAVPFEDVRPGFNITHKTPLWNADNTEEVVINANNAFTNTSKPPRNTSKISIGKFGIAGSNALRYELVTAGHDRTHTWTWSNPGDYGFRTDISLTTDDDIIWFWLEANVSTVQRLQFSVNDKSIPSVAESYIYTLAGTTGNMSLVKVPYGGNDPVVGMSLLDYSATQAQIQVEPGWSGWIGIPGSMYGMKKGDTIGKLSILLLQKDSADYSGQKVGDNVTFDEFWLTSAGEYPTVATGEQSAKVRYQLTDFENLEETHKFTENGKGVNIDAMLDTANGLNGSKALAYKHLSVEKDTQNPVQLFPEADKFGEYAIHNKTDLIWMWVDSDLSGDRCFFWQINGTAMSSRDDIYTIVDSDADGVAEIKAVSYCDSWDAVVGMAPVNYSAAGTDTTSKARIYVDAGWSGWIGIPVGHYNLDAGSTIANMQLRMMWNNAGGTKAGEFVYYDEIWITSAGMMPGLTDEELLWDGADPVVTPDEGEDEEEANGKLLWNADSATIGTITNAADPNTNRDQVVGEVVSNKGLIGTNALAYRVTALAPATSNQKQADTFTMDTAALTAIGFDTTAAVSGQNDILWFWVKSEQTASQRLQFQVGDFQLTATDSYIYTIVENAEGKAEMKKMDTLAYSDITFTDPFVPMAHGGSGWARIRIEAGASGWIGIPVNFMRTSAGATMGEGSTITKIAMIMGWYPDRDDDYTQRSTSSIYFDEFWLTSANTMPKLLDWQLLGKEAPAKELWNTDNITATDTSAYFSETATGGQATTVNTFAIEAGKGYKSSSAIKFACNTGIGNYTNRWFVDFNDSDKVAALGINDDITTDGTEILWFYVDGTGLTNGARLDIGASNGTYVYLMGGVYYTIEDATEGCEIKSYSLVSAQTSKDYTTTVNKGTRGTIPVANTFKGWIGIPLADFGTTGITDIQGLSFFLRRPAAGLTAGDTAYIGNFWIGEKVGDTWAIPTIAMADYN